MRALPMRTTFSSFLFSPFSLYISVSVSSSPSHWRQPFSISKARQYREQNDAFCGKNLSWRRAVGTRKPLRRATRERRPMDVHVFVSLTQRLGFGHQSGPKFPFGKPHDQKLKKIGTLSQTPIYFCFDDLYVFVKRKKVLNPQLAARRRTCHYFVVLAKP